MKLLLQRVGYASITIDGLQTAAINRGLLVFIGLEREDTLAVGCKLLDRLLRYRVFPDEKGQMNLNVQQVGGEILLVSQFTLAAQTDKGLRPGFSSAMAPDFAKPLYDNLLGYLEVLEAVSVASGCFGADMKIQLENDGPATFMLSS